MEYPKLYLKAKKEIVVKRFHPWIFSGAIQNLPHDFEDGTIVQVYSRSEEFLATGHFYNGSIAVKIFSYEQVVATTEFWTQKLESAYTIRKKLGFTDSTTTNAYRLIHGEGDGMPGLIIDVYKNVVIFQAHSIGMYQAKEAIALAIQKLMGDKVDAIYDKSKNTLPKEYAHNVTNGYIWGDDSAENCTIVENDCKFNINWVTGQKTGFFLDQRDNRALLGKFAKDKKVLNAFCYSGGFSIYALLAGAKEVHSVDSSAKAIDLVEENLKINNLEQSNHKSYVDDVLRFLKGHNDEYEVMVLDPPAYAKSAHKRHRAVQAYKRLNVEGMRHIAKGGILFTFSCSQVVDNQLFYNTITAAAIEAKRTVRVLHRLTQPADHPVNIFHPEGNYLKGLVLYVE